MWKNLIFCPKSKLWTKYHVIPLCFIIVCNMFHFWKWYYCLSKNNELSSEEDTSIKHSATPLYINDITNIEKSIVYLLSKWNQSLGYVIVLMIAMSTAYLWHYKPKVGTRAHQVYFCLPVLCQYFLLNSGSANSLLVLLGICYVSSKSAFFFDHFYNSNSIAYGPMVFLSRAVRHKCLTITYQ